MSGSQPADTPEPGISPEMIAAARGGTASARGALFEKCRAYLQAIALGEMPEDLQAKAGASDIVQQTFLEAHQDFAGFRGTTEGELLAWLRQILRHNVVNFTRHYRDTEKRQVGRERPLADNDPAELDLAEMSASPSSHARAGEEAERLARALERLTDDQRLALQLRQQDRLTFAQIGQRMNRSAEAARKLWARALDRLREEMRPPGELDRQ